MDSAIQFENVSKQFGNLPVIEDFSARIAPGEIVSLVGPSGCGKSTLLRLVAGVEALDRGRIKRNIPLERIGFVFQDVRLLPWRTALQNVTFVLRNRLPTAKQRDERARAALKRVGLADFSDYLPAQLSGGMQKRVAIARALTIDPELILLDEPFSDLDLGLRLLLIQDIQRLLREGGKTAWYVTHDIREALILSDRVFVLSARPARMKDVITLPKTEQTSGALSPELLEIEQRVIAMLRVETQQQMAAVLTQTTEM
jgi:NitT/TauT family transport system ATP-binding protein